MPETSDPNAEQTAVLFSISADDIRGWIPLCTKAIKVLPGQESDAMDQVIEYLIAARKTVIQNASLLYPNQRFSRLSQSLIFGSMAETLNTTNTLAPLNSCRNVGELCALAQDVDNFSNKYGESQLAKFEGFVNKLSYLRALAKNVKSLGREDRNADIYEFIDRVQNLTSEDHVDDREGRQRVLKVLNNLMVDGDSRLDAVEAEFEESLQEKQEKKSEELPENVR